MRKYFIFFVLSTLFAQAQKHEFGFGVGGTNYKGDYTNDNFELKNYRPAILLFYKNNYTPAVGLRYHIMVGGIKADDPKSSDPVYVKRGMSFQNVLYEGAMQIEYNFLNYRSNSGRVTWTPYFAGGLGLFYFLPYSNSNTIPIQPIVPVGIGLRIRMGHRWNFSAEAVARKTFTDLLDNVSEETYGGNANTLDWYFYNGICISYSLYKVYCPKPFD